MANLALYRKYRPKTFAEVIGQEHIVQTLMNAVSHNLLSHAYLFSGPRGSGKTTIARLLAKAVNCQKPKEGEPCNACAFCLELNEGRSMDLVEIDAASNRGIDEMRALKEGIGFLPSRLKYKVFIVDEAHQLTKEASNALLKTLEEPPSHAIFILATTELHKMISTIVSRCQRYDFRRLKVGEIVNRLQSLVKSEKASIEPSALELVALNSGGSLRDAEGLLDKVLTFHSGSGKTKEITVTEMEELLGIVDLSILASFVDLLLEKNTAKTVEYLNSRLEQGMDPYEFAKNLIAYLREALLLKVSPNLKTELLQGFTKEQQERILLQSSKAELQQLQRTVVHFEEAENRMKYASIVQLPLELAIIDSCSQ
ncbi:MAG: DNA polymerase III, subunit gamma and tau [Candidatus Wildermuthbacteria bacterium RIFCSPHIGHO2_01_FULL_48_25]|uniref:DNA polymerase III subunit gamma/tau n=1 Tax=Candidatus Wildermuthbacteria bacterium RIFCSPLOWO2_01_FULL_48_16 TaxID=1802461 RepID=A0A1G2RLU1_9BACT|nr:MAG: DNA polymerase III, subunit gamma and tau [Candidatus Wildermuthbacteria bacterium RIFCSPHIGHO2_01_FULL_48_25]OHA68110.1 MAG: DNA polymerase III, subunit gamma and tau [Candidatus Wildermuthbacteria bacterium RIFCSPHIGHO2_02_FULL_49_12b]OHA73787.1 MAG: DNA polymerase III, subunit gamma and tau [Candidatus Wildermuthbacteria bacterium RIFCSPLOWO2_01_FULL_48_16]